MSKNLGQIVAAGPNFVKVVRKIIVGPTQKKGVLFHCGTIDFERAGASAAALVVGVAEEMTERPI